MSKIKSVQAYEILASGGLPTIECVVETEDGFKGVASVSYGASAGSHEAVVLSDQDPSRYGGKGVLGMCKTIGEVIAPKLVGMDVTAQQEIDDLMIALDGTTLKSKLGGNTILAVSMAVARAGAASAGLELFAYLEKTFGVKRAVSLPKPMVVVIEGGAHADKSTDFQEYLITVTKNTSAKENVRVAYEVYAAAKKVLKQQGYSVNVGNEGAFAPEGIDDNELPFQFLNEAIVLAGYKPGVDVWISLDPASSEFYKDGKYHFTCGNKDLDAAELLKFYEQVVQKYPIYSLEDAFAEDAWPDWAILMQKLGDRLKIIGEDMADVVV